MEHDNQPAVAALYRTPNGQRVMRAVATIDDAASRTTINALITFDGERFDQLMTSPWSDDCESWVECAVSITYDVDAKAITDDESAPVSVDPEAE